MYSVPENLFLDEKSSLAPLVKGGIQEVPFNKGDLGGFALRNSTSFDFANIRQKFIWIFIITKEI